MEGKNVLPHVKQAVAAYAVRINHCSAEHWSAVHEYAPMRYVIDQV